MIAVNHKWHARLFVSVMSVALIGCGSSDEPEPLPTRVIVTPDLDSLVQGDTVQFTATPLDEDGDPLDAAIVWSAAPPAHLTIDANGLAIAHRPGLAGITGSASGITGVLNLSVNPLERELEVFPGRTHLVIGGNYELAALPRDSSGRRMNGRPITWQLVNSTGLSLGQVPDQVQWVKVNALMAGKHVLVATARRESVVDTVDVSSVRFVDLAMGYERTCATATTDVSYCWGSSVANRSGAGFGLFTTSPQGIHGGLPLIQHSLSDVSGCGVTRNGEAWCWGTTLFHGGYPFPVDSTPTRVGIGRTWQSVWVQNIGYYATTYCGLSNNRAYCWGENLSVLGVGDREWRDQPTAVAGNHEFQTLAHSGSSVCGITTASKLFCWGGYATRGRQDVEIGACDGFIPDHPDACEPNPVLDSLNFVAVEAQAGNTCAITVAHDLYCWGDLVHTYFAKRMFPGIKVIQVAVSSNHGCVIREDGEGLCWGDNGDGQLGIGRDGGSETPVPVVGGHRWRVLRTMTNNSCGITTEGITYCWGQGYYGQVGDGSRIQRKIPTRVIGQE